jgi:tetratricopeptide (TPR) repeat protein
VVLALTAQRWLPALPTLFGTIQANRELIGAFADLTTIATFALLLIGVISGYLGFRSLRSSNAGGEARQAVEVAQGGRGAAVGGDVNQGTVVVGDSNQVSVEISGDVIYNYADATPSSPDRAELEEARRRLEVLPLEDVPDRAATLPLGSVMRLRPNPHFVGRREALKAIASNLKSGDATAIGEVTVAASGGLGGVGKTQLACEFVYRYGRFFHGVYWLSFAEPGGVSAQVAACGGSGRMELHRDFHTLPLEEQIHAVMSEWQNELPRLLVFDNCEDEDLLNTWLPPTGGCRVLVTSRRSSWDETLGVAELPLNVFSRQESVELLRKYCSDLAADSPELDAIADELGDLPLALDLAGRFLRRYRREVTPSAYLAAIRQPDLLEHRSLREARGISPTRHDMDVWRTFAVSYWRLDADDEIDGTAIRLLARAARLSAGVPIPDVLLAWTLEPPESDGDPPRLTTTVRDALDRLLELGLLESSGEETLRMHPLVAAFTRAEVPDVEARQAVEVACSLVSGRAFREGQPARQEALLPHLRFVTDATGGRADAMAANLCTALSISLSADPNTGQMELGAYDEALPFAERAWEISIELYGPGERATLQRRSNIGFLLERKKDRVEARTIYEEVLEAQERVLGPEDPDVAATLNNLGASYSRDDLYHETLPLYRRALRIREDVWERTRPDDPDRIENAYELAEGHGNLGALLMDLGRHGEAGPHLVSALEILADEVELAHERNAHTLVVLGRALRAQRDYPGAVSSIESALTIYMNIGRTYSADSAQALANAGAAYMEWVDKDQTLSARLRVRLLDQASGALHGALSGSEQMYGEDYPMTGGIIRALAEVCYARGDTEHARRYRDRAEANRRANLGAEDADTASALNAYGDSLTGQGLYDEAHAYLKRALDIREEVLGEQDFDTSTSFLKLGILLQFRGQNEEARRYLERALAVRVEVCGGEHPASALVRENLELLDA